MQRKGFFIFPQGSIFKLRLSTLFQLCVIFAAAHAAVAQISVSSVSPASGPLAGGNTVRLLGSGFTSNTSVWFWANQAPVVSFVSSNEIDVQVPAKAVAGPIDIAVFNSESDAFRLSSGYSYSTSTTPVSTPSAPTGTPAVSGGGSGSGSSGSGSVSGSSSGSAGASGSSGSFSASGTALSACGDLTSAGSYYLANDVSSSGTCFFIDADNISLNLNGHTVTYATGGGSQPAPGVLLADNWYTGYGIAQSGSTMNHANFEIFNGSIVESQSGPAKSPAIWVGQSNDITPAPRIHDLTLTTYTSDSSPIFGTVSTGGWQVYNNKIYYSSPTTSSRYSFYGYAIWIGDQEQAPTSSQDLIHDNFIYAAPQGGIRDTHQNAKIYNNDITFSATYSNDFCVDLPADNQLATLNNCHPSSGRGFHVNANNVQILANKIAVQELPQNGEYGGCELGGAYGVQVEFDTSFLSAPPVGVLVSTNQITATGDACDAVGMRLTSMTSAGSVNFVANVVNTTSTGNGGKDYGLQFSAVNAPGVPFTYAANIISSQHAFVGVDWDGANTFVPAGQIWNGSPTYAIDNENGFNAQGQNGPTFSQSLTIQDALPSVIHCGPYAAGPVISGSTNVTCN